jgi:type I restriction enzyme R subunit
MVGNADEREWKTRKQRIDPRLDALGWKKVGPGTTSLLSHRTEEEETDNGPADYALWLNKDLVGIVEAKKVTVGPQNVLTQAERYSRGARGTKFDFGGFRVPFVYSTNGEVFWFHDLRHPLNRSRRVAGFHTPNAFREMLTRDFDADCAKLVGLPHDHPKLRPYQKEANAAVDRAIAERKRNLLVAMATGTGKTFTLVNQIYRLMKAGVARRVLFLVDRRALAAQAVRAFSAFEAEPGTKFDQLYEVYSSRFQTEDFGEEERFDPKILQKEYLTDPKPGLTFVYVCTIQRMAISILGKNAIPGLGDEEIDPDVEQLDIPIHAFDAIVADECHRGYTAQEQSVWRATLEHFDAIKIGLTATPAAHTTAYFSQKVFEYSYKQAVEEGYLVDYDVVNVRSEVRMQGVFLHEGENVELVDRETGLSKMDQLEDERQFDTTDLESKVTAPASTKKIVEELKKYSEEHEKQYGRFPKTLIFGANDLPHVSHADQLVNTAREVFNRGDAFVEKITGRVDRPLQRIREFRNRPNPGIAVTVDLLTTGVDIPDLEFLVFLRPVKSRILFEQMLGRGTRKGEKYPDKSHFTVFDCFDGTLLAYFRKATGITAEVPDKPTRKISEVIEDIWNNRDRDYNVGCLVKRLQRIDKQMAAEARDQFAAYIPDGDVAKFARGLKQALASGFVEGMKLLRDKGFQELLVNYPTPQQVFYKAYEVEDEVRSTWMVRDSGGNEYKPGDYLEAFAKFVKENEAKTEAIRILLDRPRAWNASALTELRDSLKRSIQRFTIENLEKAHAAQYGKALVEIISMVKHAANVNAPLLTAVERTERAFAQVTARKSFTDEQRAWLNRIRQVMIANLSIERDDFEYQDALSKAGGWGAARRLFGERQLSTLLTELNGAIAA